ncbi:unnamed protein product [Dicrocoelium dendriticum]|nr:unnamed protein product [Dicrocoelium dendriticum]
MVLCSTCDISLTPEDRVAHIKSDWHIYNLKRIVAGLPAIPETMFTEKKQFFTGPLIQPEKKTYCDVCKTPFVNSRSYVAHLASRKHSRNAELKPRTHNDSASNGPVKSSALEPTETDEPPQALRLGSCLFCDRVLPPDMTLCESERDESLAQRILMHMFDSHSFQLPYPDNIVNAPGLLRELGRIVGKERACLACGRQFYGRRFDKADDMQSNSVVALKAVRNHMLDKAGHMRVWCGTDDPVEVALLVAENEEQNPGCSEPHPAALAGGELFSQFYDKSVVVPPLLLPSSEEAYEVQLPSGTTVGHRSLKTIYQQRLPALPISQEPRRSHMLAAIGTGQTDMPVGLHTGLMTGRTFDPLKRIADRHSEESRKKWELVVGLRGNDVYRSRLRRQY